MAFVTGKIISVDEYEAKSLELGSARLAAAIIASRRPTAHKGSFPIHTHRTLEQVWAEESAGEPA